MKGSSGRVTRSNSRRISQSHLIPYSTAAPGTALRFLPSTARGWCAGFRIAHRWPTILARASASSAAFSRWSSITLVVSCGSLWRS